MTWREFQLKLYGFRRQQKDRWEQTKVLAYQIYLTIPEKGHKKSIDQFWPENSSKNKISQSQKLLLLEAHKKAMEEAKKMKV